MERQEYGVEIAGCNNGMIVNVGCKKLVVPEERIDEAFDDLKELMKGGYKAANKLSAKWLGTPVDEPVPYCHPAPTECARP